MKMRPQKIDELIAQLDQIIADVRSYEAKFAGPLAEIHPQYNKSAINLVHYLALRHRDLRDLQKKLGYLGLSRLAKAEGHVLTSLNSTRMILNRLKGNMKDVSGKEPVSIKRSTKLLRTNTKALFGNKPKGRHTRIMVTLPAEAAKDYNLVYHLVRSGMNIARINCAHDNPEVWKNIINNVNKAELSLGKTCKIFMDLAGPKLRTGCMKPGPKVIHVTPVRDDFGRVISPAVILLSSPKSVPPNDVDAFIPVSSEWLEQVSVGDKIHFQDARGKNCHFDVVKKEGRGFRAHISESTYISTGLQLIINEREGSAETIERVGELLPIEHSILLKTGDILVLHKDPIPGEQAVYNEQGRSIGQSHISCTLPEIFKDVKEGEVIRFDDGKIEGTIQSRTDTELVVRITYTKAGGSKLRADKGINLPESNLTFSGLTEKDKEDLTFIARHAHAVNLSFINDPQDVQQVLDELAGLNAKIGIVLKIETRRSYKNLPELLLTAMKTYPVGVMIARGDLAIECGWRNMARIQQEILLMCEAAHIPDIWATQVLENLARKGLPSRAEITDAATSQQAECVMLNKGDHILEAIRMLDTIIRDTEDYQDKKAPLLPELNTSIH
jgi:pyruvate kinase